MGYNDDNSSTLLKSVDWFTVFLYAVLVVWGAVSIYAASYDIDSNQHMSMFSWGLASGKQFVWIGLSFIIGFSLLLIDRRIYEAYAYPIYALMIILLLVTAVVAPNVKGSHSWLKFGVISLQPAEFAKTATALALGKLFSNYNFSLANTKHLRQALLIIFLPILCILLERETGSALVYLALIFVLYREGLSGFVLFAITTAIVYFVVVLKYSATLTMGIPTGMFIVFVIIMALMLLMLIFYCRSFIHARNVAIWYVITSGIVGALEYFGVHVNGYAFFIPVILITVAYLFFAFYHEGMKQMLTTSLFALVGVILMFSVNTGFNHVLREHQQQRIKVALGIDDDIHGAGYNVNQSKIAIGSGGLTGKGFLNGTQTKLKYVPEQHTDFIFCTIGEEQGFIGSALVLIVYLTLILRVIALAERQHTAFGRVYAYCVASILIFHLAINVGMVIGLCPVIGIPLPFFSYGGSSLWGFTFLLFILLRIDAARKDYGAW